MNVANQGQSGTKEVVGVLFGGRSVEHEISIITALQVIKSIDITKYTAVPIYIDQEGKWFTGDALLEKEFYRSLPSGLSKVDEVSISPSPGKKGIMKKKRSAIKRVLGEDGFQPIDVFLLAFHGQYGEDGCIQGLLELADIPYTGGGVCSMAVAMNKNICKLVASSLGIPVLPSICIQKDSFIADLPGLRAEILNTPGLSQFPLFVKPNHLGSSIGIGKATDIATLDAALVNAARYDTHVIVEPCVTEMFEINISVLGRAGRPVASCVEIPVTKGGTLSYEEKYLRGGKKSAQPQEGMASLTRVINPPDLDQRYKDAVTQAAIKAFSAMECSGIVRFDFMVDLKTGQLYFNELNPIPGSFAFYLWEKSEPRILFPELTNILLEEAKRVYSLRSALQRNTGFKAMFGQAA